MVSSRDFIKNRMDQSFSKRIRLNSYLYRTRNRIVEQDQLEENNTSERENGMMKIMKFACNFY